MSSSSYLPLHWESTGNKWWYASPIDLAAANGHYDLVLELLRLDMNLLIKLTSLRRIRRLESLWDDDRHLVHAAKCRSYVAQNLLLDCEIRNSRNSLIRAGYGGWLLYTAASAGDNDFVEELLGREPLLVFGEGEYGIADILYAAARSKNIEVFKTIFERVISPCMFSDGGRVGDESPTVESNISFFRWEIVNRAVFAAARGGNLEVLMELLMDCSDVLAFRDNHGATIFHASAGSGQVEIVNHLITTFNIIESRDNRGNTALHIAAFQGHLHVVEALIFACPSLSYSTNNDGETFLHMAIAGFQTSGFRRLDHQLELMRRLISGEITSIHKIINMQNCDGRTVLHTAVVGSLQSDLVELLMTVPSIDLSIQDIDGMTPLDLLCGQVCSVASDLLVKEFVLAGGISSSNISSIQSTIPSRLKKQSIPGNSPGTSFRITDAEIFLSTGIETAAASVGLSTCSSISKSESEHPTRKKKRSRSLSTAARKLRALFGLSRIKEKKINDDCRDSFSSVMKWSEREETLTPLRQTYSNSKQLSAERTSMPSPETKSRFAASLMHGVFRAMPRRLSYYSQPQTPESMFSCSQDSSPLSEKQKGTPIDNNGYAVGTNHLVIPRSLLKKSGLMNARLMSKFFCGEVNGMEVKSSSVVSRSHGQFVPPVG